MDMNRREVLINPAVLAWALGLGLFLSVSGAVVVAPMAPVIQLLVAGAFLGIVVPVVYLVLDADDVARHDVTSRVHFPYFVVVTVTSVLAAAVVPVSATGQSPLLVRGFAFLVPFSVISWAAIWLGRDADTQTVLIE